VTLALSPDGSVVERKKLGRRRARYPAGEERTIMLQIAYDEIAVADPPKLRKIIENAETVRVTAQACRQPAIAKSAIAIKERAERRLAALKRQAQN
jgi:hypothetical protein